MIIELNSQNDLDNVKKQFYNVFKGKDPFGEIFNDSIEDRLIICPAISYRLDDEQLHALIKAIESIGETTFTISEVEFDEPFIIVEPEYIQPRHWKCTLPNIHEEYNET